MLTINQNHRIRMATQSFTTRNVPLEDMHALLDGDISPQAGDLLLARITEIGHHGRSERIDGRRARLFTGDEVILAYGNRYAPDQFEAIVPQDLGPCHMVAAGGIAGQALSWHQRIIGPTCIEPVGLVTDRNGNVLNLRDYAVPGQLAEQQVPSVVIVGTSMNAGKTTSAAHIIHGLNKADFRVGAMKVTGTGAGNDLWLMQDAGAEAALDFSDAGFPTTFKIELESLMDIVDRLSSALIARGCNAIVVEIADGVYQRETRALLENRNFNQRFNHVVFTAREAVGATNGVEWLKSQGYHVPAISGRICASPLALREAQEIINMPVYGLEELMIPELAESLLFRPQVTPLAQSA